MSKTETVLIAVGGGESGEITRDSLEIAGKFLECAKGADKKGIVVMAVATDDADDAGRRYEKLFGELKFSKIELVDISQREESFDEAVLEKVKNAAGLYFTGGDQLHITALMGGTPLHDLLIERFSAGVPIAGTSAGAMMMSSSMLVSGTADCAPKYGSVEVAPGANFLTDSIIDTHFSQRGRHGRLLSAVAHNPQILGLGIDERTAAVIRGGNALEVIGEGAVTVVCLNESDHTNLPYLKKEDTIGVFGVKFHILPRGYRYDIGKREPIKPSVKEMMKGM